MPLARSRARQPSPTLASLQPLLPRLTPAGLLASSCLRPLARSTASAFPSLPGSLRLALTAFVSLLVTFLSLTAALLFLVLCALHDRRRQQRQAPAGCLQQSRLVHALRAFLVSRRWMRSRLRFHSPRSSPRTRRGEEKAAGRLTRAAHDEVESTVSSPSRPTTAITSAAS